MPKAKKKATKARTEPVGPRPPAGEWLNDMADDELQLCCKRLKVEPPATREERLVTIRAQPNWCHDLGRLRTTKNFAGQLQIWRGMVGRGSEPLNWPWGKQVYWLFKLDVNALKLMCTYLGLSIEGDYDELILRLEADPHIEKYKPYMSTPGWRNAIKNCDETFANYKPQNEHTKQLAYSHVPTNDPQRNAWLDRSSG